jgi:hypothetical protein
LKASCRFDDDQVNRVGDLRQRLCHLDQLDVTIFGQGLGDGLGDLLGVTPEGLIDDESSQSLRTFLSTYARASAQLLNSQVSPDQPSVVGTLVTYCA